MIELETLKGNKAILDEKNNDADLGELLHSRVGDDHKNFKSIDDLHDPYLLKDLDKAVERIDLARQNKERVMIFGDYDVDGVTSTSLLMHAFKKFGITATYRVPHRVHDGYGLKKKFIDEAKELNVGLVVTVDCGTKDIDIIDYAKSIGVDVIVTDHHNVPEIIPESAIALVNPKRKDCKYPAKNLAGAGVAFKLVSALAYKYLPHEEAIEYICSSIDIAAIGTVADCMVLTGENRAIVLEGLKQLKKSRSRGIQTLIDEHLDSNLDADIFGFFLGPRLNAAGRMDTPYTAVNLLLNNESSVNETLREIENLNSLRKEQTKLYTEKALSAVDLSDNLLFFDDTEISHGIIGIVAGRLTEQYYKPSIVLKDEGDKLVASCRSPEYFSMIDLLDAHKDYFIGYGGHKQAAGFSIAKKDFQAFKQDILETVNAQDFSQYKKSIQIIQERPLDTVGFNLLNTVIDYKPYGMGNEKPLFLSEPLYSHEVQFLGKGREHIKINNGHGFKIFGFFIGNLYEQIKSSKSFRIIYDISEDNWQGRKSIMLRIEDIIIVD